MDFIQEQANQSKLPLTPPENVGCADLWYSLLKQVMNAFKDIDAKKLSKNKNIKKFQLLTKLVFIYEQQITGTALIQSYAQAVQTDPNCTRCPDLWRQLKFLQDQMTIRSNLHTRKIAGLEAKQGEEAQESDRDEEFETLKQQHKITMKEYAEYREGANQHLHQLQDELREMQAQLQHKDDCIKRFRESTNAESEFKGFASKDFLASPLTPKGFPLPRKTSTPSPAPDIDTLTGGQNIMKAVKSITPYDNAKGPFQNMECFEGWRRRLNWSEYYEGSQIYNTL
ncbi:hypothetical protein FKM82_029956 [Ascaphus truei]